MQSAATYCNTQYGHHLQCFYADSFTLLGYYAALILVAFRRFGAANRSHLEGSSCHISQSAVDQTTMDLREFPHRVSKICSSVSFLRKGKGKGNPITGHEGPERDWTGLDCTGIAATELPLRVHLGLKLAGPLCAAI
jgi:hypothetical protein